MTENSKTSTPFRNITGLNHSALRSDLSSAQIQRPDTGSEISPPQVNRTYRDFLHSDEKTSDAKLNKPSEANKNSPGDDDLDNVVIATENRSQTEGRSPKLHPCPSIQQQRSSSKTLDNDPNIKLNFSQTSSASKVNSTLLTPSKEKIQLHLSKISEQLTSIKQEKDSLKNELQDYNVKMNDITAKFNQAIGTVTASAASRYSLYFTASLYITHHIRISDKKVDILKMKLKVGSVEETSQTVQGASAINYEFKQGFIRKAG